MTVTPDTAESTAITTAPDSAEGAADDRVAGLVIGGRYRLVERLGEGAMGTVFLARHEGLQRNVALKFLQDELAGNREIAARFEREAVAAARLQHPNVVTVYDSGTDERGRCFLAMEYVDGELLRAVLERKGSLPRAQVLALAGQIAAGLDHAHALGIVHRDVKPENVLVVAVDGVETAKVIDFGIAKVFLPEGPTTPGLTRTGMAIGTPEYMSPEQAVGGEVDARSDVYALAVMTYEMLLGARPFDGDDVMALLMAHLNAAPPPPSARRPDLDLGPAVDEAFAAGLAKQPAARPERASEFVARLERAFAAPARAATLPSPAHAAPAAAPPAAAAPPPAVPRARPRLPPRAVIAVVAGIVALTLALFALGSRGRRDDNDDRAALGAERPNRRPRVRAEEGRVASDDLPARIDALRARTDLPTNNARERQTTARVLEDLRARTPDDPALAFVLGAIYARDRSTHAMALAAYRDAVRAAPELADRETLVDDVVRIFAFNPSLATPAGEFLRGPLADGALEPLVDTFLRGGAGRGRAAALLAESPFVARLDATQRGLMALAGARTCETKRTVVEALGRDADARALPPLRRISIGSGCGFLGLGTCNPCLGAAVPAAIRAIEQRSGDAG